MSSSSTLIHTLQLVLRVDRLLTRHGGSFTVSCDLEEFESGSSPGCVSDRAGAVWSCLLVVATALESEAVEVFRDGRDSWKEWFVNRSLC